MRSNHCTGVQRVSIMHTGRPGSTPPIAFPQGAVTSNKKIPCEDRGSEAQRWFNIGFWRLGVSLHGYNSVSHTTLSPHASIKHSRCKGLVPVHAMATGCRAAGAKVESWNFRHDINQSLLMCRRIRGRFSKDIVSCSQPDSSHVWCESDSASNPGLNHARKG